MIHDDLRELQQYLTPPPTPLFKRESPLLRDEETRKWDRDEFTKSVIETCEKYDFKDLFVLNILEKTWWGHMIAESIGEDREDIKC